MANDRMYLVCPGCGESFMLAKRMGGPWYTMPDSAEAAMTWVDRLDNFFDKHFACDPSRAYDFALMNELQEFRYRQKLEQNLENSDAVNISGGVQIEPFTSTEP